MSRPVLSQKAYELKSKVNVIKAQLFEKEGKMLQGRQLLKIIVDSYKVDPTNRKMYDLTSLIDLKFEGGSTGPRRDDLSAFGRFLANKWDQVLLNIDDPQEDILESLFRQHLGKVRSLQQHLAVDDRIRKNDGQPSTYARMRALVDEAAVAPTPSSAFLPPLAEVPVSTPQPAAAPPPLPRDVTPRRDLPAAVRDRIPDYAIDVHVYNDDPARRFILIRGERFGEGSTLEGGHRLLEIAPRGLVIDVDGQKVLIQRPG